ncbi:hypothetical protein SAMN05216323_101622 [Williamwhitmania taraxaci]|uniref:Uncharacterized protein n=1 Tax=Williamwhitmania taraxaci TaxID=1640674 RepID=A0A1G6IJ94_9BACT|nr:hypothetical protein SAMN05216323_101622 [Williamwhitmania taraxaci]
MTFLLTMLINFANLQLFFIYLIVLSQFNQDKIILIRYSILMR